MKALRIVVALLAGIFVPAMPALAQFTAAEVAAWPRWEAFLADAAIVESERLSEGVTSPWKLTLEKDGVERAAAWKGVDRELRRGVWDSWKYEIAAYRLDRLLGLDAVPPAVERPFQNEPGALVLWIDFKYSLAEVVEKHIGFSKTVWDALSLMTDIYYIWGCLVANDDPTQQNIRYTEDWRMIFIDHSRAFRSDRAYTKRLVFGAKGIKKKESDGKPFLFKTCPRALYERIRGLDAASIAKAVGPYLTAGEIDAILARRKLLMAEIDGLILKNGEDAVLY